MRTALCLAALAALLAVAAAGPIVIKPGCHSTDTIQRFSIKGSQFTDSVKRNFVNMAYIQARTRGSVVAKSMAPKSCAYSGHKPIRACYNSVIPGRQGGGQIGGQYGFVFMSNFKCGSTKVSYRCSARLNTQRENRPLAIVGRPGFPDFWEYPSVVCRRQ